MIKHIANPFLLAFMAPFLIITMLIFVQFQLPQFEFFLITKKIVIPSGYDRLLFFAEFFHKATGAMPFGGEYLQQKWLHTFAKGDVFIQPLFAFWVASHIGLVVGTLNYARRWLVMYITRQYEKQSLINDKKLIK